MDEFHFLRPEWFYALIPAVLVFTLLRWRQRHHSNWENIIDLPLLSHLLDNPGKKISRSPLTLLLIAWVLAVVSLAGPVWEKKPLPLKEREDALVVILDLSKSMLATDIRPDRLVRAKRKLIDLLEIRNEQNEGVTGLIVFAGESHLVSPLTDDTATIIAMIPALTPDIMPAPGSRLTPALERALGLFEDGGAASGRILIIADEIRDLVSAQRIARQYRNRYPTSVLSVGTAEGASVPLVANNPSRGYLKDRQGRLVIPKLDEQSMQAFANLAGGRYSSMTLTEEDLNFLLADQPLLASGELRDLERDFDVWFEEGPWLLLLLVPLASLTFRRGWVWALALIFVLPAERSYAFSWDDLWASRHEQAQVALAEGNAEKAAELFEDPAWKATANYRNEDYETAATGFAALESADGNYNVGNALARLGRFEEAIEAYGQALDLDPEHEDASFNKGLIEQLLEQQQQAGEEGEEGEESQEDSEGNEGQQQNQQEQEMADQQEEGEQNQGDENQQAQNQQGQEQQEQEQQEQEEGEEGEEQEDGQQMASAEDADPLDEEERQALRQWLRRVPDHPGGLLQRKFQQQHRERQQEGTAQDRDHDDW